jgi:hypothetical protein
MDNVSSLNRTFAILPQMCCFINYINTVQYRIHLWLAPAEHDISRGGGVKINEDGLAIN